jgi:hypothetical protein
MYTGELIHIHKSNSQTAEETYYQYQPIRYPDETSYGFFVPEIL